MLCHVKEMEIIKINDNDDEILVSNCVATELMSEQLWQIRMFWENSASLLKCFNKQKNLETSSSSLKGYC